VTALAMVFKLVEGAQRWHRLAGGRRQVDQSARNRRRLTDQAVTKIWR
jgi:hypothetical protein